MNERADIRLQTIVLVTGVVLMGIKFLAWWFTHSNAVLSDAMESIVNVVAGGFALYASGSSLRSRATASILMATARWNSSARIEGALIVIASVVIVARATQAFIHGNEVHELGIGIALTTVAGALNLLMGLALQKQGRKQRSITMEANDTHLLGDAWSTLAMLIGLLAIALTGIQWLDSLFAIGFGLFILVQGALVVRRAVAQIMDETDMEAAASVRRSWRSIVARSGSISTTSA
ncbi:MAG: cation diffusion facilitator family transporter [Flavobacteriales bacterium]|nr:cation diffusion facilitator family transporter [Flavobacteriales bacterium]